MAATYARPAASGAPASSQGHRPIGAAMRLQRPPAGGLSMAGRIVPQIPIGQRTSSQPPPHVGKAGFGLRSGPQTQAFCHVAQAFRRACRDLDIMIVRDGESSHLQLVRGFIDLLS